MSDDTTQNELGHTELPADLLTPTLGSAYGIGEFPDMAYGMGVLEGVQAQEPAAVPTGLAKGSAEGMDLRNLVATTELADLDWLDPTQLQDPERLPKSTNDTVIPELVEAWGVNRRTNGIQVVSRDLAHAQYEESLEKGASSEKRATAAQMTKVVAHAMRRSAAGHDIDLVVKQALESMGEEMGRIAAPLRRVRQEHGLAGNIFIRASAYPGYSTGRWSKQARAMRARYIIVSKRELEGATWIQDGRCTYSGKVAVTEVPWKEAEDYFARRFDRRLAAEYPKWSGTPQDRLKRAFLSIPKKEAQEAWHPEHSDMQREGYLATPEIAEIESPETKRARGQLVQAHAQVRRWARDGFFSDAARDRIIASSASPQQKVRTAVALINQTRKRAFSGANNKGTAGLLDARTQAEQKRFASAQARLDKRAQAKIEAHKARQAQLAADAERAAAQGQEWLRKNDFSGAPNQGQAGDILARQARREAEQARIEKHQKGLDRIAEERKEEAAKVAAGKVAKRIESGLRGRRLVAEIKRIIPPEMVARAAKYIDPLIRKHNALAEPKGPGTYQGTKFTHNATPKQASEHERTGTVRNALRYVRKAMSEGFAGKDLDSLIANRFSEKVRLAMQADLTEVRKEHEGGAGFLYVEAAAYATPEGVRGCEAGGLKHRANQIPAVLKMARCGTCTHSCALMDGTRRCAVYNKVLLDDATGPEMERLKQANVRVANMDDGEQTQSLFAPTYDPNEFGLRNSNLEDISPELPEHEKIGEIMFGGWDL